MRPWAEGCEGNPRNQDDNRRVDTVMHDAQIRAIVPITVQIIVREPVAIDASSPPKHNCYARHAKYNDMEFKSISAVWVEFRQAP